MLLLLASLARAEEPVEAAFPSSPPTSIDDAETVERGHVEVNLTAGFAGRAGAWESETPLIDGNLGVSDNIHINAEIPLVFGVREDGFGLGLGHAAVASKIRFVHTDRVQAAIHPAIDLPSMPWGAWEPDSPLSLTLPAVVDVALGQGGLGLGVQLAHTWAPVSGEHSWSGDLGLAHPLGQDGTGMLNLALEAAGDLSSGEGWLELGYVRESLFGVEGLSLLSSAGVSNGGELEALLGVQVAR